MTPGLCAVFFLSGASALLFQTLWFRQAGLLLGNSVWASSVVLASFMGGLALGGALAGRRGHRLSRPVRLYALLELAVAATGVLLVLLLPRSTGLFMPLLRSLLDQPVALNLARLLIAFVLLLIPSTAMGATLPILVKALARRRQHNFGDALGKLYGFNTLGAVFGALAGEAFLLKLVGVHGAALVAAAVNIVAAGGAWVLARGFDGIAPEARDATPGQPGALKGSWSLMAAAFAAGAIFLALEVVWFRFMLLFIQGSSLSFAIMLAVVLAGIGLGGLWAGAWLRRHSTAHRFIGAVALAAGVAVLATYRLFPRILKPFEDRLLTEWSDVLVPAAGLMLPVALLSGLLFPLLGAALQSRMGSETRASGYLVLSNTLGAMVGSVLGGFVFLPHLGMEMSLFVLALLYVSIALLAPGPGPLSARPQWLTASGAAAAVLVLAAVLYPFGNMESRFLQVPVQRFAAHPDMKVQTIKEGPSETIVFLRNDLLGEPYAYQLITNGFSMSTTSYYSRRYMKYFVYWPLALHPDPKDALLICYGVGSTAKALADAKNLEHIDVVDVSSDILQLSEEMFAPEDNPLRDPRVTTHVEDGRFFLQSRQRQYDLITGEPPPPKFAGIVNLYTREYFQLMHDRLTEDGIVTYWLPVHNLYEDDTRAIINAFCDVFPDASLWVGSTLDWVLIGSRGSLTRPSEDAFRAPWLDPQQRDELVTLGFELPEQLGASFVADAPQLRRMARNVAPLVDNFPLRLSSKAPQGDDEGMALMKRYGAWISPSDTRVRFSRSKFVQRIWPPDMREAALEYFDAQDVMNRSYGYLGQRGNPIVTLHDLLENTTLTTLPLWLMGSDVEEVAVVKRAASRGVSNARVAHRLGLDALVRRDFSAAADHFGKAMTLDPSRVPLTYLQLYALCQAGRLQDAETVTRQNPIWRRANGADRGYWNWMHDTFELPNPYGAPQ